MRSGGLWLSLVLAAAWIAEAEQQHQCAAEKTETERQRMIIDISHAYRRDMPAFESAEGLGEFVWLVTSMKNGSIYNFSVMKMGTHSGTHVDAPGHVFDHYFDQGLDVDTLDLHVLNGPALLVDVPRNSNITGS